MSQGRRPPNRLARESSPYLLLHATNPVDWYPWGEEAFERARREDKPIFLSVGYSTCYWCHVMERESFSDEGIARKLNEGFVSVKLDREERPDLDEIYMTATQLLTRSGGWPNSLFLNHDLEPFFAGTYFPPSDRYGRPGFPRLLEGVREAWQQRRAEVDEQARAVGDAIRRQLGEREGAQALPGPEAADAAQALLARAFDPEQGGFGGAPKFPSPSNLFFLLERARRDDGEAREMLVTTLERMARGGIHDQLAGGFHRYSTDELWLVPHFEKMLYDNASLARLYAEASRLPERPPEAAAFERVARATCDFVLGELRGPHGGLLSAIDAETHGHEGAYYTWTADELRAALTPDDHALLAPVWGFDGAPNFEHDRYVLHLPRPWPDAARAAGLDDDELRRRSEPGRRALLAERARRERPLTDDKVLCDWNGLMIAALARVGALFHEPRYLDAARGAARFLLEHLRDASGELLHAWRDGRARVAAVLDDYAFLIDGLLALHAADGDAAWLEQARRLQDEQDRRLHDADSGAYFASVVQAHLLVRARSAHDGALPSGNGVASWNLLELHARTGDGAYRARAEGVLRAFGRGLSQSPLAHVTLARSLERLLGAPAPQTPSLTPRPSAPADAADDALVSAEARYDAGAPGAWKPLRVELRVADGWHVQANPASLAFLTPTRLHGRGLRAVVYPPGEPLRSAFADATLAVYGGTVVITGEIEIGPQGPAALELTCQPCDDSACQRALTLRLEPRPAAS
jgi:hypothetical protein